MKHRLFHAMPDTPQRGDIVGDKVFDGRRWVFVAAAPDISLRGEKGVPGRDGIDGKDSTVPGPPGRDGADSTVPGPRGPRGPRGRAGEIREYYSSVTRRVVEGANHDIELAFLEDAYAGTPLYLECDDKCGVTNSLSRYRLISAIGFAVNDTIAGSRGLVRTAGLITVPHSLGAGGNYLLSGYGELAIDPTPVAAAVLMGVAIDEHRLLIRPQVLHITNDVLTANLATGSKGQVVALVSRDSLALYVPGDEWAVGVLTTDVVDGVATYCGIGSITQADWSAVLEDESTTLTPNTNYYGGDTPGKLTTDSVERLFIGVAKSTTKLNVSIGNPPPYESLTV